MSLFNLKSDYTPAGDQPLAIENLVKGLKEEKRFQTLLGATGTGKTFTIANVIQAVQRPTLVIAHNKTLAAQLCSSSATSSPTTPLSISSPTTTTISPKPTFLVPTPL